MRWLARLTAAVVLSGVAVAAVTVAGWPRPRVVRMDTDSTVRLRDDCGPDAPYRLIQELQGAQRYWFLAADGTLLGPWRPGRLLEPRGFDAAGRLVADTPDHDNQLDAGATHRPYELVRYDPATAREEVVFARPDIAPFGIRLSQDLSTLVVAIPGDPIAFVTYDVADGRQRDRLTVPGRAGGVDPRQARVATNAWGVTPDGRGVVLAEAWDGGRRFGPPGVDILDAASGRLQRRIDFVDAVPPDAGVGYFGFSHDGGSVTCYLSLRVPSGGPGEWRRNSYPTPTAQRNHIGTGELLPPWTPNGPVRVAAHGGQALWVRGTSREYRVTDSAGKAVEEWRPLPGEFGHRTAFVRTFPRPGSAAAVYRVDKPGVPAPHPWVSWLNRRLGRTPPTFFVTCHYLYHDYSSGEFQSFHTDRVVDAWSPSHAVGPHDLAILTRRPDGGTLTLWDLPPRQPPWPWSVPAGVALGVLLTAIGVWLRGAARTRLNRRAELMK